MKNFRVFLVIALVSALGLVSGCEKQEFEPKGAVKPIVTTVGNHSYIPIAKESITFFETLTILDEFEKNHPEFEVTSWNMDERPQSYLYSPFIYGLWINHRPRERKGE